MLQRSTLLALGAILAPAASAQVFYGSDGTLVDNWRLDTATGVSNGPEFTNVFVSGLADDDAAQVFYVQTGVTLSSAAYSATGSPVTTVGTTTYLGSNRSFTGLAHHNGVLYASHNAGSAEGLYAVDVVTLAATLAYPYSSVDIALEGLDFDPSTGLLYGANDGGAYVDPLGVPGRGITVIDLSANPVTERTAFPYPAGENDLDGLAFDAGRGRVFLIEDESSPLHNVDIATGLYDPNPPQHAATGAAVFSAGTYTTGGAQPLGTNYCTAAVNSSGVSAAMSATGSTLASANDVTLRASRLPNNAFGFFLTSRTQGFIQNPGGSPGNLCLSGSIGRFVGPGQIQNSGAAGAIELGLNLTALPTPVGGVAAQSGETWNFTAWYRDVVGGSATSNFADGLAIVFQ